MKTKLHTNRETVEVIDHVSTGKDFKAERRRLGISQSELAVAAGFKPPYLHDLELGRRKWTRERLNFWLELLSNLKQAKSK